MAFLKKNWCLMIITTLLFLLVYTIYTSSIPLPDVVNHVDDHITVGFSQIETDKILFVNIMKVLEKLKDENIFKLGKRYFTTSMYDAIMLSLSENMMDLEELDIEQLGKKIAILKEDDNFNKYVGSASSNPTSITNKVKIARKVLLDITE